MKCNRWSKEVALHSLFLWRSSSVKNRRKTHSSGEKENSFEFLANITEKCQNKTRYVLLFNSLSIPLVVLAKLGYNYNNKDCGQNGHSDQRRCLTTPTELLGNATRRNSLRSMFFYSLPHFRRSQTLSPVRYNNNLVVKEPVTVKSTTEQVFVSKPYKVNGIVSEKRVPLSLSRAFMSCDNFYLSMMVCH